MSASERILLVGTLAVGLFVSLFLGLLLGAGCGENGNPAIDGTGICGAMSPGTGWWAAVLGPSALLLASQLIPLFRRHALIPVTCVVLAMSAFWAYILADASGNLG